MTAPPGTPAARRGRWLGAAAPAVVLCAALAPLAVEWLSGRTLAWFDTQRLYAPQRWLVDEALRSLRLPLWNPFMGGGMPLLADAIHGVLHPVSVLTAWLRTDRSVDVLLGGHMACAALGAGLLARDHGASRAGAAVAALSYAQSGFVLSMAGNLVFAAGAGSLPWCVAGLRRAGVGRRTADVLAGVGGVAALAFSGDMQALCVGLALGAVLACEGGGWRGGVRAFVVGALGLLVAAVQLVPSAVHVPRSVRSEGSWTAAPAVWALEPWRLAELVLPGLLRGAEPYADPVYAALAGPGAYPSYGTPMPFAASLCIGVVPASLAVAGARAGRRGALLASLALLMLWVALGPALGADRVLGGVPVWRAFRYSEKLVGPLTLAVATLAALGLDAVAERRRSSRTILGAVAVLAVGSIAMAHLATSRLPSDLVVEAQGRVARGAWHLATAALALGAVVGLRERLGTAGARVSLALVAWGGLAAAAPFALHAGDPDARLRAPGPALEAPAPGPRIATPYMHDLRSEEPGPAALDAAAREHAVLGYPAYNVRARLDSLSEYSAMTPARLALLAADGWSHWPLAPRRFAATHVVVDPPTTTADRALYARVVRGATLVGAAAGRYQVWAVPHREWASFAPEVRSVPDEQAALAEAVRVIAAENPTVVVEAFGRFGAAPGRVIGIARGIESLRVEAEAPGEATLVVADAWWPGWEATVDGVAVPVFRADALVRAVRWPPGRHVLEMRYRPPEVRTGLLLSAAGLAVVALWAALERRRARRRALTAATPP